MNETKATTGWSKEDAAYDAIRGMALRLGAGEKMPTINELCAILTISRSTLDRVFRKLEGNHIIRRKHGSGIFVSEFIDQKTIGLVIGHKVFDSNHSQFWVLMLQAAQEIAKQKNADIRFYFDCPTLETGNREGVHIAEDIKNDRLDGLISVALPPQREWLKQFTLPNVSFGRHTDEPFSVSLNNRVGYTFAAESLIGLGCTTFGFFGHSSYTSGPRNSQLFREALQLHGFTLEDKHLFHINRFDFYKNHYELGYYLAQEMFGPEGSLNYVPQEVEGLAIADDLLAKGFLDALNLMGIPFRDHFHIATMANHKATTLQIYEDHLNLIQFPVEDVMSNMFELLGMLMEGGHPHPPHRVIEPILVKAKK
jgi:DNA-binding LacI/PurR family transcriptional regulator